MSERVELPQAERCETCRFWKNSWLKKAHDGKWNTLLEFEETYEQSAGECRRYPPKIVDTEYTEGNWSEVYTVEYPPTYTWMWCGEYQPATVAPPAPPVG